MWRALVKGAPPAWERLFEGYGSCMDWPSAYYWKSFEQESLGLALIRDKVFGGRPGDRANAIAVYQENVKAVKATVPPERLQQRQRLPERGLEGRPVISVKRARPQ